MWKCAQLKSQGLIFLQSSARSHAALLDVVGKSAIAGARMVIREDKT